MADIYVKGLNSFKKHEKAPDFVLGKLIITLDDVIEAFKENKEHVTQYNGKDQLKVDVKMGNDGKLKFTVDTYKN